jgi:hypothetical protein
VKCCCWERLIGVFEAIADDNRALWRHQQQESLSLNGASGKCTVPLTMTQFGFQSC